MSDNSLENACKHDLLINKLNELQTEATKEVMRMSFFLNFGGITVSLTAFGNSAFQSKKCLLTDCIFVFILGLSFAVIMALESRKFAYDIFSKAVGLRADSSVSDVFFQNTLKNELLKHRGKSSIIVCCVLSLAFFALGVIIGLITLLSSL